MLIRATSEDYADHLNQLLPLGEAWPRDPDSVLGRVLLGLAGVLARAHNRALDLVEEADPRTAVEMLPDWERICGLPDDCGEPPVTLIQRRQTVVSRLTSRGGQSRAYFIAVAAELGFQITITEFSPFRAGDPCESPVCDEAWIYVWQVNAPSETIVEFAAGSGANEPLRAWGNQTLECEIGWRKPGHTEVLFTYEG